MIAAGGRQVLVVGGKKTPPRFLKRLLYGAFLFLKFIRINGL
jgi:hypothetical protein